MIPFTITTAINETDDLLEKAKRLAKQFNMPFVYRQKRTVQHCLKTYGTLLIIYKHKEELVFNTQQTLFFHPNTAVIRIKSQKDPLVQLVGTYKTVLDCTMGLASDALVIGSGHNTVVALEKNPLIYYLTTNGLQTYCHKDDTINVLMRSIKTVHTDYLTYLQSLKDNSVDVIYIDPMFSHTIDESTNIAGIQQLERYTPLNELFIQHAKRVAKEKIIIKAHYRDDVFERFGFERIVRKTIKFHYGVLMIQK